MSLNFVSFLIAFLALVIASKNSRRIAELENKNSAENEVIKQELATTSNSFQGEEYNYSNTNEEVASTEQNSPLEKNFGFDDKFLAWLKINPLMKIGTLFILAAFSWFVSYAYGQGWLGPHELIFSGIFISLAVVLYGFFDTYKSRERGLTILGLGNVMLLMVIFAARYAYDMFNANIALGLIVKS